jgi:hypothetical protein
MPPRTIVPDPAPTERAATIHATLAPGPAAEATGMPAPSTATDDEAEAGEAAEASPGDPRLEVLRALERGEISVAEAGARLEALESRPAAENQEDPHA